jgi:hypothetical protein
MTLQQNSLSSSFQQFQKLWERMALLNAHITEVNKEIELVKSHIQELIGIDVSNLATLGDLSSLEESLRQYTDDEIPDLSDFVTKDEIPDLSNYAPKDENPNEPDLSSYLRKEYIFFDGNTSNEVTATYGMGIGSNAITKKDGGIAIGGNAQNSNV